MNEPFIKLYLNIELLLPITLLEFKTKVYGILILLLYNYRFYLTAEKFMLKTIRTLGSFKTSGFKS